ncbi:hypothetical protein [uncultured Kriegella sp.]|uniref:hypothetical protein n=1 Tax=uncultured Kriegella sp. TaxID=1798910 RepID=UPI0030D7CD9B|tara:strand:+ start:87246 stop:87851 length:606 start_codon:yes stop_codon:yes gene_type:complete
MRYLLISLSVFILSCSSYPKRQQFEQTEITKSSHINPYFSDPAEDYVYKADIGVFKKNFSGILIVKKLGQNKHRVVFTTEMGNTIFDFLFLTDDFNVNYIVPDMDKKILIRILEKDFKTLITENPFLKNSFKKNQETISECLLHNSKHYYYSEEQRLYKIIRTANGKEKVAFLFSGIDRKKATNIKISHKKLDLNILLKAI